MGSKKSDAVDRNSMLEAYIEKFGYGPIVNDAIGTLDPSMSLSEFIEHVDSKGVKDIVFDMNLGELFKVRKKGPKPSVVKDKILSALSEASEPMSRAEIEEAVGENGKVLSSALSSLKKNELIVGEGKKKKNMKYSIAD